MRRIIIGRRKDGQYGLWVSAPGWDADTAPTDGLLLEMTQSVAQILMRGTVVPSVIVPLNLNTSPLVLLTALSFNPGRGKICNVRPWPAGDDFSNCTAAVSRDSMQIDGSATSVGYLVFRQAI
jgi:hypothetical protein